MTAARSGRSLVLHRASRRVLLALALGPLGAPLAQAVLPNDTVVVTSVVSVDQRALPGLLALDAGTYSALELAEAFALVPNPGSAALLSHRTGAGDAQTVDPMTFVPPSASARYYDPALRDTVPARVLEAAASGQEPRFEVGANTYTLSQLLAPSGAVLIFPLQAVPEPEVAAALVFGAVALVARLRRGADARAGERDVV